MNEIFFGAYPLDLFYCMLHASRLEGLHVAGVVLVPLTHPVKVSIRSVLGHNEGATRSEIFKKIFKYLAKDSSMSNSFAKFC